jgi:hypothetical protein
MQYVGGMMGVSGRNKMNGQEMEAPPKMGKSPKFGKVVKCGNGGIFGFVGSVHIGVFINMDTYE